MKTKAFKYLKLVLLTFAMVNLTACEIEIDGFYDDDNIGGSYYNKSRDLCSRTWVIGMVITAGRRLIFIWIEEEWITFVYSILMEEYGRMNIVSTGIGKMQYSHLFVWYMARMMFLISMK